jgi:16S rRNA (guanine(966)-N(2))-methyltransferase RsmD
MRVITGSARGRNLATLEGEEITRPTSQSTKEALFSSIQFELEGKRVLDLFAGCGQLGIEALSRGAVFCTFVENNRQAYKIVEQNIKTCNMGEMSSLVFSDAVSFLNRKGTFDIAFLDPPYNRGLIDECLNLLSGHMSDGGVIICETARDESLPEKAGDFSISRQKNYGKSKLTYYRKERTEE